MDRKTSHRRQSHFVAILMGQMLVLGCGNTSSEGDLDPGGATDAGASAGGTADQATDGGAVDDQSQTSSGGTPTSGSDASTAGSDAGNGSGATGGSGGNADASSTDATAADAAATNSEACVEIFTSRSVAGLGARPFWRDARGVHIVWGRFSGEAAISSYSPETGALSEETLHVIPAADGNATGAQGSAASPGGTVVIPSGDSGEATGSKLLFTHLDTPGVSFEVNTGWDVWIAAMAWDGEAFAFYLVYDGAVWLTRYNEAGEVLLEPTAVSNVTPEFDRFDLAVDATTGTSWRAGTLGAGVFVVGNEQDGTLMPGATLDDWLEISPGDDSSDGTAPVVAIGNGGAAVGYVQYGHGTYVVPVSDEPSISDAFLIEEEMIEGASIGAEGALSHQDVALAWWRDAWWSIGANREGATMFELDAGGAIAFSQMLVEHPPALCRRDDSCTTSPLPTLGASNMHAVVWEDELWLGFQDSSGQNSDDLTNRRIPYRVVRVEPGCRYLSVLEMLSRGMEVPTSSIVDG